MIAFGSAVTKPDMYAACAAVGLARVTEPDSLVLDRPSIGSLQASYNALLDELAPREDLEAVVLLHQDTEIVDPGFCDVVRETLRDPDVGLIGCVGAVGVRSIAWWEGSVTCASFSHRYHEHGGGDLPAFSWAWADAPPYARMGEVDTIDGFLLVLSPWVARNLRFDEGLGNLHGYDYDFSLQVRDSGRKVVTAGFRAVHHHSLELVNEPESWVDAHVKVADKWDGHGLGVADTPGSWRERALRAEAERDAARAIDHGHDLETRAKATFLRRALAETTESVSWRLTAPLRRSGGA